VSCYFTGAIAPQCQTPTKYQNPQGNIVGYPPIGTATGCGKWLNFQSPLFTINSITTLQASVVRNGQQHPSVVDDSGRWWNLFPSLSGDPNADNSIPAFCP
jgi:hypothetical protein